MHQSNVTDLDRYSDILWDQQRDLVEDERDGELRTLYQLALWSKCERPNYLDRRYARGTELVQNLGCRICLVPIRALTLCATSSALAQVVTILGRYEQFSFQRMATACAAEVATHLLFEVIRNSRLPHKQAIAEGLFILGKGAFLTAIPGFCWADNVVTGLFKLFVGSQLLILNGQTGRR